MRARTWIIPSVLPSILLLSSPTVPATDSTTDILALIERHDSALGVATDAEWAELRELYEPAYAALWFDSSDRLTGDGRNAVAVLGHAEDQGLDPADYDPDVVRELVALPPESHVPPSEIGRVDVVLSTAMLRYLRHLRMGRIDPRAIGFELSAPPDRHDFPALLRGAIAHHRIREVAAQMEPPLAQYRALRAMLVRYRSLDENAAVELPSALPRTVRPGDTYRGGDVLAADLVAFGDLPPDRPRRPDMRYDSVLVSGVKHFQLRHGLKADGVLDKRTMDALRVPLSWRITQIELALERLRWLPHFDDGRVIVINIPMFRLWVWDSLPLNSAPLFGMDVIVGRALNTQTPVFVGEMSEVIFRPYWNVPTSIVEHEILPALERDSDYLREHNMEIVRGQSDTARSVGVTAETVRQLKAGTLRVRQRPGPENSLGLIKFVFPNDDDVYMHGTPAQALFARNRRDFSHGCVRVQDPVSLAEWVLTDSSQWNRDRITEATAGSETVHVAVPRPTQVILFYTTAAVMPEDGTIRFADDIYGHDVRLQEALAARRP